MMDDKLLRQMVIGELEFEPSIDAAHIGVAVEHGVVTLTGHVGSYNECMTAERVVQSVKGVRAVAQQIMVRQASDKKTSDSEIADRAARIIAWDGQIPEEVVKITVHDGLVTLSGAVGWQFEKKAAEAAVRKLSGVRGVLNLIEVSPRVQAGDVKQQVAQALMRSAEIDAEQISVKVHDDKVTLEARVHTWFERRVAERAAWSAPGVRAIDDQLRVG